METPETIRTSLQQGEWVTSIDFKDAYFHIPIQEQSRKYLRFHVQGQTYQFKALPFGSINSTLGVHCSSKGGETDGDIQGYKDPPVPRRLVSKSQIPPSLSPAYPGTSKDMPRFRLAGEFRQVGTGTQANLRFCRLPIRPQSRSGPTYTGPVAEPSEKTFRHIVLTGLSGPAVHVPDWSADSHRETSSPRPIAHEAHTVAPQKQLESTGIIRKRDSNCQIVTPSPTVVVTGGQSSIRPTITPNQTCSADLYRRIKRRVGRSIK